MISNPAEIQIIVEYRYRLYCDYDDYKEMFEDIFADNMNSLFFMLTVYSTLFNALKKNISGPFKPSVHQSVKILTQMINAKK